MWFWDAPTSINTYRLPKHLNFVRVTLWKLQKGKGRLSLFSVPLYLQSLNGHKLRTTYIMLKESRFQLGVTGTTNLTLSRVSSGCLYELLFQNFLILIQVISPSSQGRPSWRTQGHPWFPKSLTGPWRLCKNAIKFYFSLEMIVKFSNHMTVFNTYNKFALNCFAAKVPWARVTLKFCIPDHT